MADLLIMEKGSGGDLVIRGTDFAMVQGVENEPYLAMFGGDSNWWGNDYENLKSPELTWNSSTETVLNSVAVNSVGRIKIERAIMDDLARLKKQTGSSISANVVLASNDRIEIAISIDGLDIIYIWNPATEYLTYKL